MEMSQNEIIQWSIVSIIILIAIIWIVIQIIRKDKKKQNGCSCCDLSKSCKVKDIKEKTNQRLSENCHDGQSARS